ncbi:hypothetical protein SAMN02745126_05789 [Enhydrobacter aerosaccus]|uniref:GDP-mannose pyrophosphatase n=1 Tax=Enhydrobacter aerosaccus TaxID=225324 RepID=A0A1T4T6X2_9HYPH|nr:NUDIX hydrolase [Enhydrobacter aerosaccus]SKA36234.1 hypothetical protein SAMN02745126_05789 [Enhydrobacter aerosaccus]
MANELNPWKLIEKREVFDCNFFTARSDIVHHLHGNPRPYNSLRFKHFGAAVVPIDSDGSTVLIGQFRYVLNRFTWEVPRGGGTLEKDSLEVAKNELSEEAGLTAKSWMHIFDLWVSPGTTDERAPGFVAWNLHQGEPHPEPEEILLRKRVPFSQAIDMVLSGEICDMGSASLLLNIQTRLVRNDLPADLLDILR